jgi:2-oxoglutarate ferredoxin oxidoreductase subunit delta
MRDGENYMGRQSHVFKGGTPPSERRREMGKPAQNHEDKVRIFQELCKGIEECGICIHVCPKKLFKPAMTLNHKGCRPPEIAGQESCTSCGNCMIFCPDMALAVAGKTRKRRVKR